MQMSTLLEVGKLVVQSQYMVHYLSVRLVHALVHSINMDLGIYLFDLLTKWVKYPLNLTIVPTESQRQRKILVPRLF
jgi:hypothetical protein